VSNPYQASKAHVDGSEPAQTRDLRLRRLGAWAIDAAPAIVAILLVVLPVLLLALAFVVLESQPTARFFDPTVGGDPMLKVPVHVDVAVAALVWLGLQLGALLFGGRSIGKLLLGLQVSTLDGGRPGRIRAIVREALRGGAAGALILVGLYGPRWLLVDRTAFYQPAALDGGDGSHARAMGASIVVLLLLLVGHTLADLLLVLTTKTERSFADRVARTRVHRT